MDRLALELEVLSAQRALSAADGLLNVAVAEAMGIHPTDLLAADVLEREGPMTIGDLARAIHLSPGAATALVDRLEQAGLAVRQPDPASRRRVLVTPTREGVVRSKALFEPLLQEASKVLAGYSDGSLALIKGFMLDASRLLSEHAAVVRSRSESNAESFGTRVP